MAGDRAQAAPCIDLSDIPLDALEQEAPGMIMFVLDDSGSMDWEVMTPPTAGEGGLFDGMEYIFSDPGDDVYDWRENIEDFDTHRMMWMSQWSGYNGMYYNPDTDYTPWPTLANADVDNPRSHPMTAGNTLDMTAEWEELGIVVDDVNATLESFAPGPPAVWNLGGWGTWCGLGQDHDGCLQLPNDPAVVADTWRATWTADATDNLDPMMAYDVYVWRPWGDSHWLSPNVQYTVSDGGTNLATTTVDQHANVGQWVQIAANVTFSSGTAVVQFQETSTAVPSGTTNFQFIADAVRLVPTNSHKIMRRHYYVQNASGTFLVNMRNGAFEYYRVNLVNPTDNREVVTFDKLTPMTAADAATAGIVTGRSYAEEIQNFANWYSFYRKRELTAVNAIAQSISTMDGVYVGLISINGNIEQRVRPVRVYLNNVLYDESSQLLNTLYGLTISAQGTPLRNGLKRAGEYFRGNVLKPTTFIPERTSTSYPYFKADKGGTCQQAFTILFTDGFYNGGDPGVGDADSNNDTAFDGPPFADGNGETLADVAMWYFENDLNTNLANDLSISTVDPADHQHMVTFTIAFGVQGSLDTTLFADCPIGACPDPWPDTVSDAGKIDDMFHAAINGRGQFIAANNNQELVSALEALANDIDSRLGSAAALATNSIQRQVGSVIYQGTYNTANWYGEVRALPLNLTTGAVGAPIWQASSNVPAWNARNMLSHDGSAGIVFDAANLTPTQVTQLTASGLGTAQEIVDYLRGDNSKIVDNGGSFRNRNQPLGDVVHSAPIYFEGTVYIGANDGMLHAFDATTGVELFAYVPNLVYDHLSELADPAYSHKYYVDGTPSVAKVGARDVLVCGLNKGAKGYFALDVTDPTAMTASNVLWEISATTDDDLGYTYSRPFIVNTEAAGKVVIFGNGYASVNGSAVLYVVNPTTGALIKKFDTGVAGCNGLATPAAVDIELDGRVDYVYAGDLKGNMWKFDLRGTAVGDWEFGFLSGTTPQPLISVKNINGDIQPITSPPQVMLDCATTGDVRGMMVIFGTGQYLNSNDFSNNAVQSYYGIWDRGPILEDASDVATARTKYLGTFEADRSLTNMPAGVTLLEQVFEVQGVDWWALTDNQPDWYDEASNTGTHVGWYWDMPVTGERNLREPLLRLGHAVLVSTVPSPTPCDAGGTSYINIVNACTGGRPYKPMFDVDLNNKINSSDTILDPYGNPIPPSRNPKDKILFDPLEIGDKLYFPDADGGITPEPTVPIRAGMFFWRVIGQ
ncbi:MAG: PilC/PilY family type IV pilus protein [Desulfosarcina sp.]|jgi:outer membrane protein assembly factor BamB